MSNHNTDLPDVPWHEAPHDATHALWSEYQRAWYFWRVHEKGGVTEHNINSTDQWRAHQDQLGSTGSQQKLKDYLKQGLAKRRPTHEEHNEEGYTPMNLENAALLVREDITTVQCSYPDNGGRDTYAFILHNSINATKGDELLVYSKDRTKIVTVVSVDQEPQLNINSNTHYKWVIANVSELELAIQEQIDETHAIAKALKQRQASNVREQILQQFGVANSAELLKLGQSNAQSE